MYQCLQCLDEFQPLASFEQHCYWNHRVNARRDQASHRAKLLELIEKDAQKSLENLRKEMERDVTQGIRHKRELEDQKRMQQQCANLTQAAKGLSYVS
jgi:hypothetical protein